MNGVNALANNAPRPRPHPRPVVSLTVVIIIIIVIVIGLFSEPCELRPVVFKPDVYHYGHYD